MPSDGTFDLQLLTTCDGLKHNYVSGSTDSHIRNTLFNIHLQCRYTERSSTRAIYISVKPLSSIGDSRCGELKRRWLC